MSGSTLTSTISKEIKKEEVHQRASFREDQAAVFQLDRQRRMSAMKAREATELERVGEFLTYVVEGEQDKAEGLLKEMPWLALKKGDVTDLSKREFKHITGFQYALWALDWHMWKMLLKYLSKEAAALQFGELEDKGTAHGKHFSLGPLLEALNTYVKNYDGWRWRVARKNMKSHWFYHQVGGLQLLLPVHVVNEYCHPTRSFYPVPEFREEELVRTMKLDGASQGDWFTAVYNGGNLGEKFGIVRYDWPYAGAIIYEFHTGGGDQQGGRYFSSKDFTKADAEAIQSLWKVRQGQLESLRLELMEYSVTKHSLEAHFPLELSSIILGYL